MDYSETETAKILLQRLLSSDVTNKEDFFAQMDSVFKRMLLQTEHLEKFSAVTSIPVAKAAANIATKISVSMLHSADSQLMEAQSKLDMTTTPDIQNHFREEDQSDTGSIQSPSFHEFAQSRLNFTNNNVYEYPNVCNEEKNMKDGILLDSTDYWDRKELLDGTIDVNINQSLKHFQDRCTIEIPNVKESDVVLPPLQQQNFDRSNEVQTRSKLSTNNRKSRKRNEKENETTFNREARLDNLRQRFFYATQRRDFPCEYAYIESSKRRYKKSPKTYDDKEELFWGQEKLPETIIEVKNSSNIENSLGNGNHRNSNFLARKVQLKEICGTHAINDTKNEKNFGVNRTLLLGKTRRYKKLFENIAVSSGSTETLDLSNFDLTRLRPKLSGTPRECNSIN